MKLRITLLLFSLVIFNTASIASRALAEETAPADDPFRWLIEEIDNNTAPNVIAAPRVVVKSDAGKPVKTVEGGRETLDGVSISHVTFKSVPVCEHGVYHDDTTVYAIVAAPQEAPTDQRLPGILLLHGGGGSAQTTGIQSRAKNWAQAGYVVVACDLPGIAGDAADVSCGKWRNVPYGEIPRFTVTPDIKASWIYTAEATALKAFALLKTQPNVDAARIGIVGISWGGYSTTMLCGLLGDRVAAGFSVFGCGFYDEDSAFQARLLPDASAFMFKNDAAGHEQWKNEGIAKWIKYLDAGRRCGNIKAHFYLDAASNDHFFRPPAVTKTLNAITHAASLSFQFSPNDNHKTTTPGGGFESDRSHPPLRSFCKMEEAFFDYHLKGMGAPLPIIAVDSVSPPETGRDLEVKFSVTADPSLHLLTPEFYYSAKDQPWEQRKWIKLSSGVRETDVVEPKHSYVATLENAIATQPIDWFLLASEKTGDRATTVSTLISSTR
jgi:dienelactone hydrolase